MDACEYGPAASANLDGDVDMDDFELFQQQFTGPSCIEDGWPGTGNIQANPWLVDPDGVDNVVGTPDDDLRLTAKLSPCIDVGDNTAVPADTLDLDDDDTAEPLPFDMDGDSPGIETVLWWFLAAAHVC